MDIVTLEKANHLFWLGRYAERMTGLIRMFNVTYDKLIDIDQKAYEAFCDALSIPHDIYMDENDFIDRFIYDGTNPDSLLSTITRAYDNAIVLREEITGDTLAYIEMAKRTLEKKEHQTLMLELQYVLDDINAFWGSANDTVYEGSRAIMKCGKHAEKLDIQYRFGIDDENVKRELAKLKYRISSLNDRYEIAGLSKVKELFESNDAGPLKYIDYIYALTDCFCII